MQLEKIHTKTRGRGHLLDYLEVIKPRETALLVFIGGISALVAAGGILTISQWAFVLAGILIASAGANGLTNYLARDIDSRMQRTRGRALPSGRIFPPERALFWAAGLAAVGLVIAWYLHPLAFLADLVGTASAVIYRKKVTCVFPQGAIASCAPVLMGWFAVNPRPDWTTLLLCILIASWLPSHIWSIMMAHREDYFQAGITYFPVNCSIKLVSRILFIFCLALMTASIGLYFTAGFGFLFLAVAVISGIIINYASWRLMHTSASRDAWKLYKLSAFPYLGILFLAMAVDIWLR